jgi:ABC-type polysaccharide/polyol phosphate transport system ATPase subunit
MTASSPAAPTSRSRRGQTIGPPAVSVHNLSKTFLIPHLQYHTLKERVLHLFTPNSFHALKAADDVTFDVAQGEFFGIVGRNGSGKSTLLKCLAGIYSADQGQIQVNGRLSPFIELGVGFNFELTARDNVVINAIMLGLSRREARERFDEIIAFAELEDYLDLKLKNYSSGMLVRLAFSVAIRVDADVLLIDEVLAVGDASFQQKCFDAFARLSREGRAIVFVTHDMGAVERFCDRAMLIEAGRVIELGDPEKVTRRYNDVNFARLSAPQPDQAAQEPDQAARVRQDAVAIIDAWFEDGSGQRVGAYGADQPVVACMRVAFSERIDDPQFSLVLRNEMRVPIVAASSYRSVGDSGRFDSGDSVVVRARFENWLAPDRYELTAVVARDGTGADVLDHRPDVASVLVHGTYPSGAVTDFPYELEIVRG